MIKQLFQNGIWSLNLIEICFGGEHVDQLCVTSQMKSFFGISTTIWSEQKLMGLIESQIIEINSNVYVYKLIFFVPVGGRLAMQLFV